MDGAMAVSVKYGDTESPLACLRTFTPLHGGVWWIEWLGGLPFPPLNGAVSRHSEVLEFYKNGQKWGGYTVCSPCYVQYM